MRSDEKEGETGRIEIVAAISVRSCRHKISRVYERVSYVFSVRGLHYSLKGRERETD